MILAIIIIGNILMPFYTGKTIEVINFFFKEILTEEYLFWFICGLELILNNDSTVKNQHKLNWHFFIKQINLQEMLNLLLAWPLMSYIDKNIILLRKGLEPMSNVRTLIEKDHWGDWSPEIDFC